MASASSLDVLQGKANDAPGEDPLLVDQGARVGRSHLVVIRLELNLERQRLACGLGDECYFS